MKQAVVYGVYETKVENTTTLFKAIAYNTLQRIAWNGSIGWVIFSCVKRYGGMVNDIIPCLHPWQNLPDSHANARTPRLRCFIVIPK